MAEQRGKSEPDYYKILQVDPAAEVEVIEASYRALSKKYHPDRNVSPDAANRMAQINKAFDVLRDNTRRTDYDRLRHPVPVTPVARPAATTSAAAASPVPQAPRTASAATPAPGQANPAASSNGRTTNGTVNNWGAPSENQRSQPDTKSRPNSHNFHASPKSSSLTRWLLVLVVLAVAIVGGFLLAETFLNTPLNSRSNSAQAQATQTAPAATPARPTLAPAVTTAIAAASTGPVTRDQVYNYLNNTELYEGRLNEVLLVDNVLQLQVRLNRNGRIVNGQEVTSLSNAPDDLDLLRQSELTAYNLTYALFGRFSDLKSINLSLSDPVDNRKLIYRAQIPRQLAYGFSPWRGTMDLKTLTVQDFVRAAREDRILQHLGGPTDDSVRSRLNRPDRNNLKAELVSWEFNPNLLDVLLDSNGAQIGYFATRPEEEKLGDYARMFYALYTRFPNLDRILIQDAPPGTAAKTTRASNRNLFNRTTPVEWAQLTFDSRARELLDRLPISFNSPIFTQPSTNPADIQVNPGANTLVKSWQIVNPGMTNRVSQISTFSSAAGQFVLVKVPLKNQNADAQWPLPNAYFSLADAQGRTYLPDPLATVFYSLDVERKALNGPVEPGKDLEMKLIFDIPLNASGLRLIFQDHDIRAILPLTPQ